MGTRIVSLIRSHNKNEHTQKNPNTKMERHDVVPCGQNGQIAKQKKSTFLFFVHRSDPQIHAATAFIYKVCYGKTFTTKNVE